MYRNQTKEIAIGTVKIGGDNPVAIQSMTNTKTEDVSATTEQILRLEAAGCDIIRCAVPTMEAAEALREIKKNIHIPLVADIHFDYRLAIAAIENGADKIRINPGNIGSQEKVRAVVDKAKEYKKRIRTETQNSLDLLEWLCDDEQKAQLDACYEGESSPEEAYFACQDLMKRLLTQKDPQIKEDYMNYIIEKAYTQLYES